MLMVTGFEYFDIRLLGKGISNREKRKKALAKRVFNSIAEEAIIQLTLPNKIST